MEYQRKLLKGNFELHFEEGAGENGNNIPRQGE